MIGHGRPEKAAPAAMAGVHSHVITWAQSAVNVNTAPPGAPPKFEKVRIDGTNHGQLVSSNQHFQAASQANPKRNRRTGATLAI